MKLLNETVLDFLKLEKNLDKYVESGKALPLPENCYYLPHDAVLCYPRTNGDGRYPYCADGLTLWAHSSGYISLNESTFHCILPSGEGKEPYTAFFGGVSKKGKFLPVSITGVARQANEKVKRFTVFTPKAVYYIAVCGKLAFYTRIIMTPDKKTVISVGATNKSNNKVTTYLSTYINFLFMHQAGESIETAWFKKCVAKDDGFLLESVEDLDRYTHLKNYGALSRCVKGNVLYGEHTCSRADFVGGKTNSLACAAPLFDGHFAKQKQVCNFTDTAIAGDLYCFELSPGESACIDYVLERCASLYDAENSLRAPDADFADCAAHDAAENDARKQRSAHMLKMHFEGNLDDAPDAKLLERFIVQVQRQVEFAALAKNSGVSLLGVRDVTQQLEAALMWVPKQCRQKFLEVFNFIDPSGRAPRQYSMPASGAMPKMDTREFIDQGNWLISAMYTYLSFTEDYSVLNEKCGYYKIVGHNRVEATDERDSVLDHLVRIADYLLANVDEQTNCLKILYGDWNDAVDGLGISTDPSKEYGNGVSMMATLHLYRNLAEMAEITKHCKNKSYLTDKYLRAREQIERGIEQYGIDRCNGERKILHGWGDKRTYTVGGFCDLDGKSRDGLTANAFWVICGAYALDKSIKKDILHSYDNLDSKYGLRTFWPGFGEDAAGVGRIVNLPLGTAENGATYVHSTMFGIWSLFGMGEGKRAWQQLSKVLPITHNYLTTTPFIMSNSYAFNPELGMDGESMNDWFTGSANGLIKLMVRYVFGIKCDLDGVTVSPANYFPYKEAQISLRIKGKTFKLHYKKQGLTERRIVVNGQETQTFVGDEGAPAIYLASERLMPVNIIEVND